MAAMGCQLMGEIALCLPLRLPGLWQWNSEIRRGLLSLRLIATSSNATAGCWRTLQTQQPAGNEVVAKAVSSNGYSAKAISYFTVEEWAGGGGCAFQVGACGMSKLRSTGRDWRPLDRFLMA